MRSGLPIFPRLLHLMMVLFTCFLSQRLGAQPPAQGASGSKATSLRDSVRQMQLQIQQLQTLVHGLKDQADHYQAETLQLRRELQLTQEKLNSLAFSSRTAELPTQRLIESKLQPEGGPEDEKSLADRVTK